MGNEMFKLCRDDFKLCEQDEDYSKNNNYEENILTSNNLNKDAINNLIHPQDNVNISFGDTNNMIDNSNNSINKNSNNNENIKENNNENNNNNSENNNENIPVYDNPFFNISLNDSVNLGTCYIGTSQNHKKLKSFNSIDNINDKNLNSLNNNFNSKRFTETKRSKSISKIDFLSSEKKQPNNYNTERKNSKKNTENHIKRNLRFFIRTNEDKKEENDDEEQEDIRDENMNIDDDFNFKPSNKPCNSESFDKENTNYEYNSISNNDNQKDNNSEISLKFLHQYNTENLGSSFSKNKIIKINTDTIPNYKNIQSTLSDNEDDPELLLKYPKNRLANIKYKLYLLYFNYNLKILLNILKKIPGQKKEALLKLYQNYEYCSSFEQSELDINSLECDVNLIPDKCYLYIGQKYLGKKSGYGFEIFQDSNAYYFGKFSNNKRIDYCKFSITNKLNSYKYVGEIKSYFAEGYGIYTNNETDIQYEGEWKHSQKNGYGIEVYGTNSYYQGTFENGKRSGIGFYLWEDNIFYEGEWKNNYMHGWGIYNFKDGSKYMGSWKNGKMDGVGLLDAFENKVYFGGFKNDNKCGFGVMKWHKIVKIYLGFWKDNRQNGFGKMFYADKEIYGYWKEGKIYKKFDNYDEFKKKLCGNINNTNNTRIDNYLAFFEMNYTEVNYKIKTFTV